MAPALELLEKAGLFYKVIHSTGEGIPLGAQADWNDFKIIFLDVGLSQALLKLDIAQWIINPLQMFINKGDIVEAYVGQELLSYSDPIRKEALFYWNREKPTSKAELDYLIQLKGHVIPIEVKSGNSKKMKSMQLFLESHQNSPYGIRFWARFVKEYKEISKVHSYPLYAVVHPLLDGNHHLQNAIEYLVK